MHLELASDQEDEGNHYSEDDDVNYAPTRKERQDAAEDGDALDSDSGSLAQGQPDVAVEQQVSAPTASTCFYPSSLCSPSCCLVHYA